MWCLCLKVNKQPASVFASLFSFYGRISYLVQTCYVIAIEITNRLIPCCRHWKTVDLLYKESFFEIDAQKFCTQDRRPPVNIPGPANHARPDLEQVRGSALFFLPGSSTSPFSIVLLPAWSFPAWRGVRSAIWEKGMG